ncbi:hypothetical protein [Streptomyces sp. NPDC000880]
MCEAIVISAGFGLTLDTGSLVYFTVDSNVIAFGYFIGAAYWMLRRRTPGHARSAPQPCSA